MNTYMGMSMRRIMLITKQKVSHITPNQNMLNACSFSIILPEVHPLSIISCTLLWKHVPPILSKLLDIKKFTDKYLRF
mgnify:CR=1 FL=1